MRVTTLTRKTKETDITVCIDFDCNHATEIYTGIGFFDHMLTALATHSGIAMKISAEGDLCVDCHHTIEDTGIVLGQALSAILGDKSGIARYGTAFIPMDEALGFASLDISGRAFLVFNAKFAGERIGDFDTQMVEEFFRAVAFNAGITLHLSAEYGTNDHHKVEAIFKAFAHALKQAIKPLAGEVLSTKGVM